VNAESCVCSGPTLLTWVKLGAFLACLKLFQDTIGKQKRIMGPSFFRYLTPLYEWIKSRGHFSFPENNIMSGILNNTGGVNHLSECSDRL